MPQRPRSHILEAEARRAFRSLIEPLGWVVRAVDSPDYGVDDTVEIFQNGLATGMQFHVQNRGTDSPLPGALSVRLTTSQQNYFEDLDLPVLIVRYHSPTGATYAKWHHRVDPYPATTKQSVRLNESDLLTADSVPRLAREVAVVRAWSSSRIQWPVDMRIGSVSSTHDRHLLNVTVARQLADSEFVRFRRDSDQAASDEAPSIMVSVSADRIFIDTTPATHTTHGAVNQFSASEVASIIVLGAAITLTANGHPHQAAHLIEKALTAQLFNPETTTGAAQVLAAAGRIDCAIRIGDHWCRTAVSAKQLAAPVALLAEVCSLSLGHKFDERRAAAATLDKIGRQVSALPDADPGLAATTFLCAARIFFAVGEWAAADAAFGRAVSLDPTGMSRADLLAEAAGAAHHAGDYSRAITLYTAAIEAQPANHRLLARIADSLLHQGQLSAAAAYLDKFISHSPTMEPIWFINRQVLYFLEGSGFGDVVSDPDAAQAELATLRANPESWLQTRDRCMAAVGLGPTNAAAWSEIGQMQFGHGRWSRAIMPLVLAAAIDRDVHAWALAFICSRRTAPNDFSEDLALAAISDCGDEFHSAVSDAAAGDADCQQLITAAAEVDAAANHPRRPT